MRDHSIMISGQILIVLALMIVVPVTGDAATPNLCSLLSTQEVGAALNEHIQPPQSLQTGGCIWRGSGTDSLTIEAPGTGRPGFDNAKKRTSPTVPLSGVGDAAFAFASVAGFVQVSLVKGNVFLTVLVQAGDGKVAQAAATSLSVKIASRL